MDISNKSEAVVNNTTVSTPSSACVLVKWLTTEEFNWTKGTLELIIIIMSLVGNSIIIAIVNRNQRMKNATNYLIVNLSVSQILTTLFSRIPSWCPTISEKCFYYYNQAFAIFLCAFIPLVDMWFHALGMLSLTLIAFDRFFGVKFPLRRIITRPRAKIIIALIWIISFGCSCPTLWDMKEHNKKGNVHCSGSWSLNVRLLYQGSQLVLFYAFPLLLIGVLYAVTVHKLWIRRIPGNVTEANQRLELQTKWNVLKMCVTSVVTFALLWLPANVLQVYRILGQRFCIPFEMYYLIFTFSTSYYAINPLIYFMFSKDYRSGLKSIVKPLVTLCKKGPRDHTTLKRHGQRSGIYNEGVESISLQKMDKM